MHPSPTRIAVVLALAASPVALSACAPTHAAPVPPVGAGAMPRERGVAEPLATAEMAQLAPPRTADDPPAPSLDEARLVPSSCEDHRKVVADRIGRMRAEVAAELQRWHDAQPRCWAEDRRRDAERRELEACVRAGALCAGGIGLSGIGAGGGGYGAAIGLGSVGTVGRGAAAAERSPVRAARQVSGTNNQIASVDEADIVKTDGRYVYLAMNGALRIVEAMNPRVVSVTRLSGIVQEMFVEGDRAVVFTKSGVGRDRCTYGYDCTVAGDGTSTRIHVFDLQDRAHPKSVRRIELTGSLLASRRIGSSVHTVVADGDAAEGAYQTWPDGLEECGTKEAEVRARFARLIAENERTIRASTTLPAMVDRGVSSPLCAGLLESKLDRAHTFTSVISFDMNNDGAPASAASVRSRPGAVFASDGALYMSTTRRRGRGPWYSFYAGIDEASELHKFRIGARPGETRYVGSGVVPGHVLNAFAMDDLSEATRPSVLGELKIPGFSTYIHRVDADHLLSIGFDANDHGDFAYFDGLLLQLFDVSHATEPKLLYREKLGTRGSSSAAATDHLAFNYFADKGVLAVPMTLCEGGSDGVAGNRVSFSGLFLLHVDAETGFKELGGIDHGKHGVGCSTWWSHADSVVKRSVFVDDLVYSIAGERVKVQRLGALGTDVASLALVP